MKIQYDFWDTTPMRFYRFLMLLFPVIIVSSLFSGVTLFLQWRQADVHATPFFWAEVFFRIVMLALLTASTLELRRRAWRGVLFCLGYIAVAMVYSLLSRIMLSSNAGGATDVVWIVVGSLLVMALVYRYFYRRRPLFYPYTAKADSNLPPVQPSEETEQSQL